MSEVVKVLPRNMLVGLMLGLAIVVAGFSAPANAQDTSSSFALAQEDDGGDDDGGDDDGVGGQALVGGVQTGAGGTADSAVNASHFIFVGGSVILLATGLMLRRRLL